MISRGNLKSVVGLDRCSRRVFRAAIEVPAPRTSAASLPGLPINIENEYTRIPLTPVTTPQLQPANSSAQASNRAISAVTIFGQFFSKGPFRLVRRGTTASRGCPCVAHLLQGVSFPLCTCASPAISARLQELRQRVSSERLELYEEGPLLDTW